MATSAAPSSVKPFASMRASWETTCRNTKSWTVSSTGRVLVLHEANRTMGFGAELAAFVAEELFGDLDAPVRRVAGADGHPAYNTPEQDAVLPGVTDVVAAARALARY